MPNFAHHSTLESNDIQAAGEIKVQDGQATRSAGATGHFQPGTGPDASRKQAELFAGQF